MQRLLITLAIVAALYFIFFNGNKIIEDVEEKVEKDPEVLYQQHDEKAEGIDPSIHKSSDLGRFGL
jgi:hypothetical protein